jgi:hypothetical protein
MTDNGFSYVKNRSLRDLLGRALPQRPNHYSRLRPYSSIGNRPRISRDHKRPRVGHLG